MKRKIMSAAIVFLFFYFLLIITVCGCGFLGTKFISDDKENSGAFSGSDEKTFVNVLIGKNVEKISMDEYLSGVVAAEMPASFEKEALKAQAVAARTEAVKKKGIKNTDHENADICDNPMHCQAFLKEDALVLKYGEKWINEDYKKIKECVFETNGIVAKYNGEPITAVFHSTSSGMTENSRDVWGGDMPYLVSVKSEGEEESPRYYEEKAFSYNEFKELIKKIKVVSFLNDSEKWITDIVRNESGSVKTLKICGVEFKGTELRNALSLRSSNFDINFNTAEKNIVFKTKGNGHGVGMSQYGANYMAKKGYSYEDILKKYYTGITLEKMSE